jgi:hypothetical protein
MQNYLIEILLARDVHKHWHACSISSNDQHLVTAVLGIERAGWCQLRGSAQRGDR